MVACYRLGSSKLACSVIILNLDSFEHSGSYGQVHPHCLKSIKTKKEKCSVTPMGILAPHLLVPLYMRGNFFSTCACKVNFKDLSQPFRSCNQSFGNLGIFMKIPLFVHPKIQPSHPHSPFYRIKYFIFKSDFPVLKYF